MSSGFKKLTISHGTGRFATVFTYFITGPYPSPCESSLDTYLLTYLLTYSMEQSPSWEANWLSASQEIPRIL